MGLPSPTLKPGPPSLSPRLSTAHCPTWYQMSGPGVVLTRGARLAVRQDVCQAHSADQMAHQVAPGLYLFLGDLVLPASFSFHHLPLVLGKLPANSTATLPLLKPLRPRCTP